MLSNQCSFSISCNYNTSRRKRTGQRGLQLYIILGFVKGSFICTLTDISTWMFWKYCKLSMNKTEVSSWRAWGWVGCLGGVEIGFEIDPIYELHYFFNNDLHSAWNTQDECWALRVTQCLVGGILSALRSITVGRDTALSLQWVPCVMQLVSCTSSWGSAAQEIQRCQPEPGSLKKQWLDWGFWRVSPFQESESLQVEQSMML